MSPGTPPRDAFAGQNEPASIGSHAGVTRFLYDLYLRRDDLQEAFPDLDGPDGQRLVEWAHVYGRDEVPIPDSLLPEVPDGRRDELEAHRRVAAAASTPVSEDPRFGINLIGFLRAELGLGEAGRLLVRGLDAARVPVLPVEAAHAPPCRHDHHFETVGISAAAFPVNLVCANHAGLWSVAREVGKEFLSQRHSIGFWWWEVDAAVPAEWHVGAELLTEMWAGSRFVADVLSHRMARPVTPITLPVSAPRVASEDLRELEIPPGFRFLFLFDCNAAYPRKNPLGLIEAFSAAFEPGDGASLMIKTINAREDDPRYRELLARAAEHRDVHVVDRYLSYRAKTALIASCDCYVSLHRAEGLGLTMAEAMYLGKPVIATAYSGNLDFMNSQNSHLVDFKTVPVGSDAAPYPHDGEWAEPDVDHAATLMRAVFERPDEAIELGRRAAIDIRSSHSPDASARSLAKALEPVRASVRTRPARPIADGRSRAFRLARDGPTPPVRSVVGPVSGPLRRLLLRALRLYTAFQEQVNLALAGELSEREATLERIELTQARARADFLAGFRRIEREIEDGITRQVSR